MLPYEMEEGFHAHHVFYQRENLAFGLQPTLMEKTQ